VAYTVHVLLLLLLLLLLEFNEFTIYERTVVEILGKLERQIERWEEGITMDRNPLTLELNPSAQRCLTRYFTGDFAS
jgi:hypothetical protein